MRSIKIATRALLVVAAAVGLTACENVKTNASMCAYVIEDGYFDARHIEDILYPGERVNKENATARYVYCNARNYIVSDARDANVDQVTPITAKTGRGEDGSNGTPVEFEGSMHWTLNRNQEVMEDFLGFCGKYGCFGSEDDGSEGSRSASAGWLNMTQENHRFAFQRAVQLGLQKFQPDIWNDQSKWPDVGKAITAAVKSEMRSQIGTTNDYFCGVGVEVEGDGWTCPEISVTVDEIQPQDEEVRNIYNQQVQQEQRQKLAEATEKTNQAELKAAKARYGPYAEYFLGLIDACEAGGCPGRLSGPDEVPEP